MDTNVKTAISAIYQEINNTPNVSEQMRLLPLLSTYTRRFVVEEELNKDLPAAMLLKRKLSASFDFLLRAHQQVRKEKLSMADIEKLRSEFDNNIIHITGDEIPRATAAASAHNHLLMLQRADMCIKNATCDYAYYLTGDAESLKQFLLNRDSALDLLSNIILDLKLVNIGQSYFKTAPKSELALTGGIKNV